MAEELFNQQRAAPTGVMPGQPEFDEETPTPQEQGQYDQFVNLALKFMKDNLKKVVASMNDKQRPVYENVGRMALQIGKMVNATAQASGEKLGGEVVHAAGAEIVEHLMEAGDAAGIWPFEQNDNEYDEQQAMGLNYALELAGNEMLQSPEYNEQVKDEAGNVIARGVAEEVQRGEVPREAPILGGLPGGGNA
jgi:hypothetical protein